MIIEKLIKIQAELKAPKNQYNKFGDYKHRSAEGILEAVKPLCHAEGCSLVMGDDIVQVGDRIYVRATVELSCGKDDLVQTTAFARESEAKKGMDSAQITGSSSSYARKYALSGLFAIDDIADDDKRKPSDTLPELVEGSANWKRVVSALKAKTHTIKDVETKYTLTDDLRKKLQD